MADRPIIFSAPMVRALLDGRKTQTRRVAKRQDLVDGGNGIAWLPGNFTPWMPPYAVGDRLWVREAWSHTGQGVWTIEDARRRINGHPTYQASELNHSGHWWPSIHMPREFSRLTLHVTGVKVERLQDISEADAIAEGATSKPGCYGYGKRHDGWSMNWKEPAADHALCDARFAFASFINELHGGPRWNVGNKVPLWDQNPWVVAITFRVVRANIDSAEAQAA